MIRLLADENFNNDIVRGIQRENPDVDIVRVQDTEIVHATDVEVLAWAAEHNRFVLTYDKKTMGAFAKQRVAAGLYMPGVIEVKRKIPLGQAIEEILILLSASEAKEWEGQVIHLPL